MIIIVLFVESASRMLDDYIFIAYEILVIHKTNFLPNLASSTDKKQLRNRKQNQSLVIIEQQLSKRLDTLTQMKRNQQ